MASSWLNVDGMLQRADGVRQHISGGIARAQEMKGAAVQRAREAYDQGAYAALAENLAGVVKEQVDMVALQAAGFGARGLELQSRKKEEAWDSLLALAGPVRARVLLALRESLKDEVCADPDMPECARNHFSTAIDLFWDDLTVYVETQAAGSKINYQGLAELGSAPACFTPQAFRAKVLYHFLPFDMSIWGQFKDPWFWVLTAASMVPIFGVRVIFFAAVLLMHLTAAPPDEYQLVTFILMFKGAQFISSGVLMAILAAVQYYLCVHPHGEHTCDTLGPGVNQDLISGSIDFLGSCILVWLTFLILPCSTQSGGIRDIQDADTDDKGAPQKWCCCCRYDRSRGGRLAGLLGYDLVCFLVSCLLLVGLVWTDASHARPGGKPMQNIGTGELLHDLHTWQFRTAIFFARIFYSLLSFPFLFFSLPVLNGILTHTTYTGYNRQGLCVPWMLRPVPKESKGK